MDKKKDTMQAPTSVATNTITPPAGAVSLQESPMQEGQQDFQKITSTDGPMYSPEDHQELLSPRTPQEDIKPEGISATDAQQVPTSVTNSTSTPGALHLDASSMKDPQAFQKSTLPDGPMYYPEDFQPLPMPLSLEQDLVSSERAAGRSPNENTDETLKRYEKSQKAAFKGKQSRSQRQENRSVRIVSRTLLEDTTPPVVSPIQAADQDRENEDEENMTPGAVQIPGVSLMDLIGFQVDNIRMAEEDDSTIHIDEIYRRRSIRLTLEAQLVAEEDAQGVAQSVREEIEEEARQRLIREMGQVAQAERVEARTDRVKDHGSKTQHRALLCAGISVILLVIILGTVFGKRDKSQNEELVQLTRSPDEEFTQAPSFAPTKLLRSIRFETLLSNLSPSITVDNDTSSLRDRETAQSMALEWLADEDSAQLDLTETPLQTVLERYALAVLFFGTLGESWRDSLGFLNSNSVCKWHVNSFGSDRVGVYCDEETGSVIELQLSNNKIKGTFPSELGLLTRLERLDFDENSLSGSLPVEISRLKFLEIFWLKDNALIGSIPTKIGDLENLRSVDFSDNALTGTPPTEMGMLSLVTFLDWGPNMLQGMIPTEIGNMVALATLDLNSNQLAGPIPSELGKLTLLQVLYLGDNDLSGRIPSELGKLTLLNDLYLEDNAKLLRSERFETLLSNLSPSIAVDNDTSFLRDRETVQSMALAWLADEDSAQLDLTETPLDTVLERYALAVLFFGGLRESWRDSLGFLNSNSVCEWNDSSGDFDRGVYCDEESGSVIELQLKDNNVQGTLPSELGLLTRLEWLDLDGNSLFGSVPVEISSLKLLEHFWVHDNKLSGSIPTEIGNLENLRTVDFSNNVLTGTLPTEMGRLSLLNSLMWGSNLLKGTLPTEIGNIPLHQMELNSNQLAGPIPSELGNPPFLSYVDFHDNDLSGPIPSELGKSTFLSHLFFGNNDLSGPIPSELGKLTLLEELHLNGNRLQGVVPPEFANLQNVNFIYIDNNALIGGIEYLFCDRIETPVQAFWSDCDDSLQPRILCSCCTHCCLPESGECTEKV